MKNIVRTLVNSNIFIGIAALMAVFQFYVLSGGQLWLGFLEIVVFTGTVIVYILHRFISLPTKELDVHSEMLAWMQRNRTALIVLLLVLALHGFLAFLLLNVKAQWTLGGLFLIALFYAVPFYSSNGKQLRIRDFGMLKPFVLGITWALVTVILPYFNSELHIGFQELGLFFLERFLFISALCIPFDIRDQQFDKKHMFQSSLPNKIGVGKSLLLAKSLFVLFALVSIFHYSYFNEAQHFFSLAALLSVASVFYLFRKNIESQNEYYYTFYLDGSIIVQSLLIYGASILKHYCL